MALGGALRKGSTGVSISAGRVVAWMSSASGSAAGAEWNQEIAPMAPTASEWPELEVALRALAAESGGGTLFIALHPPLVQARSIQLPPVDPDDAARLVQRSAGKYFVGAREPQVVGVTVQEGNGGSSADNATHVLACAAAARVVDAIREAALNSGWKVGRIVPAQSAWLAAADHVWAKSDALVDHGRVVVVDDERTEVIFKKRGRAEGFRHLRSVSDDSARLLDVLVGGAGGMNSGAVGGSGTGTATAGTAAGAPSRSALRPVAIIGSEVIRSALAPVLREKGLQPLEAEGVWRKVMSSAPLSAAHFAPLTEDLELVSEQVKSRREERLRRSAVWVGIAAALLFAAGLGARHVGLKREVAALEARRSEIREAVSQVREAQRRIGTLAAPAITLDSVRTSATRWSLVLTDIAQQLPSDGYLTSLRMERDSVNFVGQGRDAGAALSALRTAPSLQNVRQAGQIRRDGEVSHFTLTAAVRKEKNGADRP